ncbi:macrophage receptor MARCO isoform X2 [Osmerus eperlanus]|uniref:macrophage receptor MARCO isoform X2 n=1 Tax=Osmerus eperlanus TaxID=29151 RepID=UPI002E13191E
MDTFVDGAEGLVSSFSQSNPLYDKDMKLSRSDIYSFQSNDIKPAKPKQCCLNFVVVYLILLTGLNAFLLYKVFTLESGSHMASDKLTSSDHIPLGGEQDDLSMMVRNTSLETRSMKGQLGTLKTQVDSLCGEEGQLGKLKAELGIVNASTHLLQDKLETLSRKAGPPGPSGPKGESGMAGEPGPMGAPGEAGPSGLRGEKGEKGEAGQSGPRGEIGLTGKPGEQGPTGQPGQDGSPGDQGPEGPAGPVGPKGSQGHPGFPGAQGPGSKGEKGDPGSPGSLGEPGKDGPKGDKGDDGGVGATGLPGIPGLKGDSGRSGIPGARGPPGPIGPSGFNGTNGLRGFPGLAGNPGAAGPRGEKGERAEIVRIVGGGPRGRVEVLNMGVWGTVCDDGFDTLDGTVICKMLGYHRASAVYTANPGVGKIWLDDLRCRGTETSVFDCPHNGMGVNNCDHQEDAGVTCI